MAEMKYYYLVKGDYVQSGDEYYHPKSHLWGSVTEEFYGTKYGYELKDISTPAKWPKMRRLVPAGFKPPGYRDGVPIAEQWGEEFEL